jgi:peptidoglycan hydrolase-like protein with peptidoglycan-binding domain
MTGDDVKALQAALISNNYHCGLSGANGVYGKDTAYAVAAFKR